MTRDQIAAAVSSNLADLGLNFFTAQDINDSIQDGYDEVSAYCHQIDASATINITANTSYYNLANLIPDFLTVVAVYNNNINFWLQPSSRRILAQVRWDWENWAGESRHFFPHSWEWIGVAPRLTAAQGTFTVFYRAKANTLNGSDTPKMKPNYQNLLEFYATFDLLTQIREYSKAMEYNNLYLTNREQYKQETKALALSDRIYGLRG